MIDPVNVGYQIEYFMIITLPQLINANNEL
jgi:hypothetical protein